MSKNYPKTGFTLIELLLVVSVLAVLSGILIRLINPASTQDKAEDGVRMANMEKLVLGIESFFVAEGFYPSDTDADGTIMDETVVSVYIREWPTDPTPGNAYTYFGGGTSFGLVVGNSQTIGASPAVYKYHSNWGEIRVCTNSGANDTCT